MNERIIIKSFQRERDDISEVDTDWEKYLMAIAAANAAYRRYYETCQKFAALPLPSVHSMK
jgi:hypothetical protein